MLRKTILCLLALMLATGALAGPVAAKELTDLPGDTVSYAQRLPDYTQSEQEFDFRADDFKADTEETFLPYTDPELPPVDAPATDTTDGYAVFINPVAGHIAPTDTSVCIPGSDPAECLDALDYEHTLLLDPVDGTYDFWVYAETTPDRPDLERSEADVLNKSLFGDFPSTFILYDMSNLFAMVSNGEFNHHDLQAAALWSCSTEPNSDYPERVDCDEHLAGGRLQVPADDLAGFTGIAGIWAFIDVPEREGVSPGDVNSATGLYNALKGDCEGYVCADWLDLTATPILLNSGHETLGLPGDGFTTHFDFPDSALPMEEALLVSLGEDGYAVNTTSYHIVDGEWTALDSVNHCLEAYYYDQANGETATWVIDCAVSNADGMMTWNVTKADLPPFTQGVTIVALAVVEQETGNGLSSAYSIPKNLAIENKLFDLADVLDGPEDGSADFWTPIVHIADAALPAGTCFANDANAPAFDGDGDGDTTLSEILAGSDPCNADSNVLDWDGDAYSNYEECTMPDSPDDQCTDPRDAGMHPSDIALLGDQNATGALALEGQGQPDDVVTFTYALRNDGLATDRIQVTIVGAEDTQWPGAPATLRSDAAWTDDNLLRDPLAEADPMTLTVEIPAGETAEVQVSVTVPSGVSDGGAAGSVGHFEVTNEPLADDQRKSAADCGGDERCQQEAPLVDLRIVTKTFESLELAFAGEVSMTVAPDTTIDYPFTVTNNGNDGGMVALATELSTNLTTGNAENYTVSILNATDAPVTGLAVGAQSTVDGILRVHVPAWDPALPMDGAYAGDELVATLTATLGNETPSAVTTTTTGVVYGVDITEESLNMTALPGADAAFTLTVENTGNGFVTPVLSDDTGDTTFADDGYTRTVTTLAELAPHGRGNANQTYTTTVTVPAWNPADPLEGAYHEHVLDVVVTASVGPQSAEATDTAALNLTTKQVFGLSVAPSLDGSDNPIRALSRAPGATAEYTLIVTNLGNGEDTFSVNETLPDGFETDGYMYTLDGAPTLTPAGRGTDTGNIALAVTVPAWNDTAILEGARQGAMAAIALNVTNQNGSAYDKDTFTTTTGLLRAATFTTTPVEMKAHAASPAEHVVTLRNTGNGETTFSLSLSTPTQGWTVALQGACDGTDTTTSGPLAAAEEATFCIVVTPPTGADNDILETITLTATDGVATNPVVITQALVTRVVQAFALDLDATPDATQIVEGQTIVVTLNVTNNGDGPDTPLLSETLPAGWEVAYDDCNGNSMDLGLDAGQARTVCAALTAGFDHAIGDMPEVTFTLTSSGANDDGMPAVVSQTLVFEITDLDTDEDGTPDMIDPDDDNDGFSDRDEQAALSDQLDRYSTPLDRDGDGIPNAVETFVQVDVSRNEEASDMLFDLRPDETIPSTAVPDLTDIEKITVYNVRVTGTPTAPLTRAFDSPLMSLERQDDGSYLMCLYEVRSPVAQAPLSAPVDTCLAPGAFGGIEVPIPGVGVIGIDEDGQPFVSATAGDGDLVVSIDLMDGILTTAYPTVSLDDLDGDGVPALYVAPQITTFDGGMPTTESGDAVETGIGDPDDDDANNPVDPNGAPELAGDGLTARFSFPQSTIHPSLGALVNGATLDIEVYVFTATEGTYGLAAPGTELQVTLTDAMTGAEATQAGTVGANGKIAVSFDTATLLDGMPVATFFASISGAEGSSYHRLPNSIVTNAQVAGAWDLMEAVTGLVGSPDALPIQVSAA